jgi:hypothetical protein
VVVGNSGNKVMSNTNTGGPAFPLHNHGAQTLGLHVTGMNLRDYFAAKAVTGLLTAEIVGEYSNEHVAEIAYRIADAMLKAREE